MLSSRFAAGRYFESLNEQGESVMKVALIDVDAHVEAFGIRSLSASLKEAGHQTRLILMKSEASCFSKHVLDEARKLAAFADVIGISCFSRASTKAIQVLEYLRSLNKIRVWGGLHATLNPDICVEHADIVCIGEGEGFMLELVEKAERGENWKEIANAAYEEEGIMLKREARPLISDLDELPLLDISGEDEFLLKGDQFVRTVEIYNESTPIAFNGTRGCAFYCTYCSNAKLKELVGSGQRYVRKLSIPRLMEHLDSLRRRFPKVKCFNFFDEDFCARKLSDIEQFSEEYTQRIGLPFECMVSPMLLNEEKMEQLVKAGLWRINMGMESGSDRTKTEVYNRHMPNDAVMRAARAINKYPHVVPYYFFIIGNPYESNEDLISTARFLRDLPYPFYLRTYSLVFMPGTLLYERAVRDGIIQGATDCACEADFMAGLDYRKHAWKKKHLYLNGLLYLMAGKSTQGRLGLVPRNMVNWLLSPGMVAFNEKHPLFIKGMIRFKTFTMRLRALGARLLKKLLKDPTVIYSRNEQTVPEQQTESVKVPVSGSVS